MAVVFEKTKLLTDTVFHYCPGCNHGIAHRLVAESIEELGLEDNVIGVAPVGCAVFAYDYFNCDMYEAAHGRAPAVATGIKRVHPETCVFTYQGDGDLASIGTNEIVHACHRGEKLTVIFINNAIYGMTGGPDGPHHADWPEDHHQPLRPAARSGAARPSRSARCSARSRAATTPSALP